MKKLSVLVVLVALIASIVGCSQSNNAQSSSQDLLDKIKASGVLTVGTEGTYPPFTYHDDQNALVGFDVEVAQAVAEKLGVKVQFVEGKWDGLIAGIDANKYDTVFNQVGINDERKLKYDFSSPYTYSQAALVVADTNNDIKSFTDLVGKKAAQTVTSNYGEMATKSGAEIVASNDLAASISLVIDGRADATINDILSFFDYMNQNPDTNIKIVATDPDAAESAAIFSKGNPKFQEAVNKALADLKADGTLKKISEKYFGTGIDVTELQK